MNRCAHSILCCEEPTYESITEVLYTIKQEIVDIGRGLLDNLWYGARYAEDSERRIRKLNVFHSLLDRLRVALRNQGSLCLNCSQVHHIVEAARLVVGVNCSGNRLKGLEIDSTRIGEWSIANPFCISHENWEKAMYAVCDLLGIKVVAVDGQKACELSYDLITRKIDCEIFVEISKIEDCSIKYNIFTDTKSCEANFVGILTKNDCKIGFKDLVKSHKCDIGFHDYVNVINCGVDARLIKKIYSCGMSVGFSRTKACPILITADGKEYYFSDFEVHNESDIWNLLKN